MEIVSSPDGLPDASTVGTPALDSLLVVPLSSLPLSLLLPQAAITNAATSAASATPILVAIPLVLLPERVSLLCHALELTLLRSVRKNASPPRCREKEAEDGARTRDPQLGKLVLYQLSYFRRAAQSSARRAAQGLTGARSSLGFGR